MVRNVVVALSARKLVVEAVVAKKLVDVAFVEKRFVAVRAEAEAVLRVVWPDTVRAVVEARLNTASPEDWKLEEDALPSTV